jgi:hypothetical protein
MGLAADRLGLVLTRRSGRQRKRTRSVSRLIALIQNAP